MHVQRVYNEISKTAFIMEEAYQATRRLVSKTTVKIADSPLQNHSYCRLGPSAAIAELRFP